MTRGPGSSNETSIVLAGSFVNVWFFAADPGHVFSTGALASPEALEDFLSEPQPAMTSVTDRPAPSSERRERVFMLNMSQTLPAMVSRAGHRRPGQTRFTPCLTSTVRRSRRRA